MGDIPERGVDDAHPLLVVGTPRCALPVNRLPLGLYLKKDMNELLH